MELGPVHRKAFPLALTEWLELPTTTLASKDALLDLFRQAPQSLILQFKGR